MSRKYTIEEVRSFFAEDGFTLLSNVYKNNKQRLDYMCQAEHKLRISLSEWNRRKVKICPVCNKYNRLSIDFIRSEMYKEGYILLSSNYKNNKQKLEYLCPKGHRYRISWDMFRSGQRCPYCNGRSPITIDDVRKSFESEGYKLLTTKYINNKQKLEFICPSGHRYNITWSSWSGKKKHRCLICSGNYKNDTSFVEKTLKNDGYVLVSRYIRARSKMHLVCPNGHDYYVSWDNWSSKGRRCPKCNNVGTSKQEQDFAVFIKSIIGDIIERDRQLIKPKELDIVIPSKKIAIEYCGLYWHSELAGKDRKYHLNKLEACEKKGYRLITIFEDEWLFKKEIVKGRLRNILSTNDSISVHARKCNIEKISVDKARSFCNTNHLQGYGNSSIKLGAFHNGELVSVMTFSKPSIAKGCKFKKNDLFELNRFCSKVGYNIVGGASKLLKYFERNYKCDKLFSYADRRWSDGNLYEKLGFNFISNTQPNYWYIKDQKRIHRFSLRKKKDEPKDRTEWQIRQSQGWDRIWDCGNLKYEVF